MDLSPEIIQKLQDFKNIYLEFKKKNDTVGMLNVMWDLGDYLLLIGIKKPHSFGWKVQKSGIFVKRPLIFRSFVLRRIWKDKTEMIKTVGGADSIHDVFELFPFLDQKTWDIPNEEINTLIKLLNSGNSNFFRKRLKEIKSKYIGIVYNRKKHLDEIQKFKELFEKLNIELDKKDSDIKFISELGYEGIKELKNGLLKLAKKEIPKINTIQNKSYSISILNDFIKELGFISASKDRVIRVSKVIDPLKIIDSVSKLSSFIEDK